MLLFDPYGNDSTRSPTRISPSESTSARSPPLCTRPRSTPGRVIRSRGEHGAQRRRPRHAVGPRHHPRPPHPVEVRAGLAAPLAEALDGPDPKTPPDEVVERDAPHDEVAPGLGRGRLRAPGGRPAPHRAPR